jgi:hypothetical protein
MEDHISNMKNNYNQTIAAKGPRKIKEETRGVLPPSGGGKFFDKDFPDGSLGLGVGLTKDESVALAVFSRKIDLESLADHFKDKIMAKNAMRAMWAIRDSLHWEGTNI